MIDYIGEIRRIQSKNAAETFDPATDSLEAIADALGIGPAVGLSMFGRCDPTMPASTTVLITDNLPNLEDDLFNDEFYVQVILNANAPGVAPEGEIRRITDFVAATQTFTTDAFSANVEANDLILILHECLVSTEIVVRGTFTLSDLINPEDNTRTEGNGYFTGCLLMPTEGAARFQPRLITSYTGVGGVFSLDTGNPFSILPGLVDYIIIRNQTQFAPVVDGVENRLPADTIGHKQDTPVYALSNFASLVRYIKAMHQVKIVASGTADAGSDFDTLVDAARTEANNYWDGLTLMMVTGNNAGLSRPISEYMLGAGIDVRPAFPNAIAATDVYVILSDYAAVGRITASTYAHPNGVVEQDVLVFAADRQQIDVRLDVNALTENTTIREYEQIDGANYRQISAKVWPTDFDTGTEAISICFYQSDALYKITMQSAIAEGAVRDVPYRYMLRSLA